jgi:hypothetical protein
MLTAMATFISLVIPWCIALPFQTGFWLNIFTNWTSLLFIGTANFLLPFGLFHLSQKKARMLQTLELAREAAEMNESDEKQQLKKIIEDNKNKDYFTREPIISLPPPPPMSSNTSMEEEEKEKSAFQKHLERHLRKLEKQKLENPQLERLKRAKVYRNMSADAVPIDELPDPDIILKKNENNNTKKNDSLSSISSSNNNNEDYNINSVLSPSEIYEADSKSYIPSHPSTPRSVSTDDEEFYNLFNYVKPFKAFPGTSKKFSMIVSYSAASISIILISGVIIYDFIGLANGKNYFDLGANN